MESRTGRVTDHTVTAAWLYYETNQTQQQIADRLGVSRATVVRLLQVARDEGLVEIRVTRPLPDAMATALELEKRLAGTSVHRVVVADGEGKQAAATAAGRYLADTAGSGDILGVGWSTTLALIDGVSNVTSPPQRVVQLVGSVGPASRADGYEITLRLARTWGVPASTIPAPVFAVDARTARALLEDPVVAEATRWFDHCTMALVGIGSVSPESTMIETGYLATEDLEAVESAGGIGDVLGWYFDGEGRPVPTSWSERVIGASLDQLKGIENVVAVAAGHDKCHAVAGALRSGVVNTLIVDSALAHALQGAV